MGYPWLRLCEEALSPAFTVITPVIPVTKIAEAMGTNDYKVQEVIESVGKRKSNGVTGTHTILSY